MNPNLQHYHVPVNADIHAIETMFVEEDDKVVNPLGVKAWASSVWSASPPPSRTPSSTPPANASGELPITPEKLL